jgi:hypothetical protein
MNNLSKMTVKLVAAVQILAITLLAACSNVGATTLGATAGTIALSNICHATGDPANPYEEITITSDIYPVPANGCPASAAVISDGKITICHATNSETNPYNEITVSVNGLDGHGTHEGDIITSPENGCPKSVWALSLSRNANGKVVICHATDDPANPYEETAVTDTELNDHLGHPNDIIPVLANGCPASPAVISDGKITVCHATNSATNPYEEITVSVNGLNGHSKHAGDNFPAPEGGCPTSPLVISAGKITICHATSSIKNPYNEITVSVNGLNGHGKHAGDIIPAPEGGCPAIKQ